MAAQAKQQKTSGHVLPRWFEVFQDTVVLSFLVTAGAVLTGLMYTEGLVPNPEDPRTWGLWGGIKFVAFFIAGFGVAGVALRASAEMARSFRRGGFGGYFWGLVFLLISLLFGAIEIWANITERSKTHTFTPADTWVLQAIGHPSMPVSPTVIALAVAQSAVLLVWGMVVGTRDVETEDERAERHRREEDEAAHKQRLAQYDSGRIGAWVGKNIHAVKATVAGEQSGGNGDGEDAANVTPFPQADGNASGGFGSRAPDSTPGPKGTGSALRKGQWTSGNLREYALSEYGVNVSKDAAQDAMSALYTLGKAKKVSNRYVASERTVRAWVDGKYGAEKATGTGER